MQPRASVRSSLLALALIGAAPGAAAADGWDLSVFGGLAYPTYDQRFTVRTPTITPLPGLVITPGGDLTIDGKGGAVFGAAACYEIGVLGIEGRFDSTAIDVRTSGLTYDLSYAAPPLPPVNGSVSIEAGPLETDRLSLLSLNLRVRTRGQVSFVASGGLSYLPDFAVTGTTPVRFEVDGLPALGATTAIGLRVSPAESGHRFGVNGGAGLRFSVAPNVSLFGEGRVFYFGEYDLTIDVDDPRLEELAGTVDQARFRPVVVNAVGGVVFSF
jgi:opacity protein-like surface antigen